MEKRVRVLYSFAGRLGRTGIGVTAWHQVRGLVDEGLEVHLFCGTCEREVPGIASVTETMRRAGIKIPYRLMGYRRVWSWHDSCVARAIRAGIEVDLLHCWPLAASRSFAAARERGIATLLERPNTHTRFAFEVVADELRKLKLSLPADHSHRADPERLAVEEQEYQLADYFLCPADFVAKTFTDRGFAPSRIAKTQYGFDPKEFWAPSVRKHRAKLTVGFVGSCEPRKGLHFALEAWTTSRARRVGRFVICGRFVPGYKELLAPMLADETVEVMGFTTDVPAVMRECDVLVLPSIEEGSALVTYEARASGCVLMVSDAAGARCEHMVDGLVHKSRDVATIRAQFDMLSDDAALLERLRAASLAGVPALTWQAAAKRLASAYRNCLSREDVA